MHAIVLNGSLKPSPEPSNTAALAKVVTDVLRAEDVTLDEIRLANHEIAPGVVSEAVNERDEWPEIRERILAADIVILATPTWLGQASSVIKRALERMDAFLSEEQEDGRPITYDKVVGIVITGNEDGAHHIVSQLAQAALDLGFTCPAQNWTYWNKGPGPGDEEFLNTSEREWSETTGRVAARNILHVARLLADNPLPKPES